MLFVHIKNAETIAALEGSMFVVDGVDSPIGGRLYSFHSVTEWREIVFWVGVPMYEGVRTYRTKELYLARVRQAEIDLRVETLRGERTRIRAIAQSFWDRSKKRDWGDPVKETLWAAGSCLHDRVDRITQEIWELLDI